MKKNIIYFFKIYLSIPIFLMVVIGCATAPPNTKSGEQSFDPETRIYENHDLGYQIWFPKGYTVYIDESELKRAAQRQNMQWRPWMKLLAINEKEYTRILMGTEKNSMGLKEYFEASLPGPSSGLKVISSAVYENNGIPYAEYAASGVNVGRQNVTMRSCCFDLINYKVFFTFFSPTNIYNNDKIEGIIQSFRRSAGTEQVQRNLTSEKPSQAQTQQQEASKDSGIISITSDPVGAKVFIDGEYKGQTPAEISLPIGAHQLFLQRQLYEPYKESVSIEKDQKKTLNIKLLPEGGGQK
jgi:hypothetical protein